MAKRRIDVNPLNALPVIIMLIAGLILLYYLASGVFWLVAKLAWGLLAGALIINYKVVLDYGKMLFNLLKKNPLMGIVGIGLSVVFHPAVFLFLFGKALLYRKIDTLKKEFQAKHGGGETTDEGYTEYEEIDVPEEKSKPIELPRRPLQEKQNEYEELFDDDV